MRVTPPRTCATVTLKSVQLCCRRLRACGPSKNNAGSDANIFGGRHEALFCVGTCVKSVGMSSRAPEAPPLLWEVFFGVDFILFYCVIDLEGMRRMFCVELALLCLNCSPILFCFRTTGPQPLAHPLAAALSRHVHLHVLHTPHLLNLPPPIFAPYPRLYPRC